MGKETLKFGLIFGSLPAFPSLRPKVKRERSQVALFLLCVVSPGICINVLVQLLASCVISDVNCITIPSFVFHSDYTNDSTYT